MGVRFNYKPVLLYTFVFFLSVLSRTMFSPLLLDMERDLGIGHATASSFFLIMSIGYSPMVLLSGFVASVVRHRGSILLSTLVITVSLVIISVGQNLVVLQLGMLFLGIGSGLYTASGISCVINASHPRHVGKAIAIHESGANLSSIAAPLIALLLLGVLGWRRILDVLAGACLLSGVIFLIFDQHSSGRGHGPRLKTVSIFFKNRNFWILALFFILTACAALGIYSILPTYLISERHLSRQLANGLISVSRIIGVLIVFFSGALIDKFGAVKIMAWAFGITGLATIFLGFAGGVALAVSVVLQPMLATAFFPAGLAILASIGPPELRNIGISLLTPFALLLGGGFFPTILGILGESERFYLGIGALGILMVVCLPFIGLVKPAVQE